MFIATFKTFTHNRKRQMVNCRRGEINLSIDHFLLQEESDEDDHVDIDDITPYDDPGSLLRNRPTHPTPVGQSQGRRKPLNPYDNVTDSPEEQEEERKYLNVEEMRGHERMSSCE